MSKNLIVLFIIVLLIVGGFGIYTYDQSNQAKKEVEEKNLKLESNDELISELKGNIQETVKRGKRKLHDIKLSRLPNIMVK